MLDESIPIFGVVFICLQKNLEETAECKLQYPSFEVWLGYSWFFLKMLSIISLFSIPNTLFFIPTLSMSFRACLGKLFSSLNFRHSISITHHSSLIFSHSFGNITFIFITQFFHTIHGSHTCQPVQFFFFFLSTQLTEANIKKKKTEQPTPTQRKKRSQKVVKSCDCGSPMCV